MIVLGHEDKQKRQMYLSGVNLFNIAVILLDNFLSKCCIAPTNPLLGYVLQAFKK